MAFVSKQFSSILDFVFNMPEKSSSNDMTKVDPEMLVSYKFLQFLRVPQNCKNLWQRKYFVKI